MTSLKTCIIIYIYIYIFANVKFQKLIPLSMLYTHTLILLFLVCYFETVHIKNDSKTIFLRKYSLYDI